MLNKSYLKDHFGIYAWVCPNTSEYLYVGSTTHNFYSRWIGHTKYQTNWKLQGYIQSGAIYKIIIAYPEKDKNFRTQYQLLQDEANLIKEHQPVCNTQFRRLGVREQLDSDMRIGRLSALKYLKYFAPINYPEGE